MTPRSEFVLASAVVAAVLQWLIFNALALLWWNLDAGSSMRNSLLWLPAPMLAAGLAARLGANWHARAAAAGRHWQPFALVWRTVLLAMIFYPVAVASWLLLTAAWDQVFAAQPATFQQTLAILPTLTMLASGFAVVLGAVPALAIEYFPARRYLRRVAGNFTGAP